MLKTFSKGGIHPPENKISAEKPIENLSIPDIVTIPVSQHIGKPSKVIVKRREKVKVGQLIAESSGFISANIHSSVSGTVTKIDSIVDSSGYKRQAVFIKVEGDEWLETIDRSIEINRKIALSADEIVKKVNESGIVGLGGATFPTHVKLSVPKDMTAEILLINGVECEPYLTSDHRLMIEKAEEIVVGTRLLMTALGVEKAVIGIENNKEDAINNFTHLLKEYDGIEVQALKVKYPQGGEKQLIKAITGREVPSGGLPIAVGAVVHNVGTAFAVYEAIQKNKPLFERVVTITGKSVNYFANFVVRIGTPISKLIDKSGGFPDDTGKIISGGPMMGKALNSLDIPVTKGTSGVLLIRDVESKRRKSHACIRCAKCITVCPMGLEPYVLMTATQKKIFERVEKDRVLDCIECGSCSYVCPSDRPLLDYIRLGKANVGRIVRERNSN